MSTDGHSPPPDGGGRFVTTQWSVVLAAGDVKDGKAQEALSSLCQVYWQPLYAFVRHQGHNPQDAEDLTQEFFARLLARHSLEAVHPCKGRFRSFLLAAMKHFLTNEWARARRLKRGGGHQILPLDGESAESQYRLEPRDGVTPEKLYERRWAFILLDRALARLADEYQTAGKHSLFLLLQGCLTGEKALPPYTELAAQLGTTEGAVKVAVHRLRHRYREVLRDEIALTVADPGDIDEEIRHLFQALG